MTEMQRRLATCFVLLFLGIFGIGLLEESPEVVELVLPENAVHGEPVGGFLHGGNGETAHANAAGFSLLNEASLFEDMEVFEDGRHGDVVRASELSNRGLSPLKRGENTPARGVAEGAEGCIETG